MTFRSHIRPTAALAAIVACLAVLAACAPERSVSPGVPPELKHSWEVNFNRGDAAAVAALYAPDAQLLMSGSAPVVGAAAIRAAVESMIKTGVKVKIDAAQNVGAADLAYVYGAYSILEHAGGREVERGTYVEVWRRVDGAWKITIDINATGQAVPAQTPKP
jgi:uncharacterized protein (TIGR02246 family)